MKILFWLFIALDVVVVLFFFVLGLAAAGSTKDNPLTVALYIIGIPGLLIALAIALFVKGGPALRVVGVLMAAAPALYVVIGRGIAQVQLAANVNEDGEMTHFRAGPLRDLADAIARDDVQQVSALVKTVDVNKTGLRGMTFLVLAVRRLEDSPAPATEVIKVLLAAGAKPNQDVSGEYPLEMALGESRTAGTAPALALLEAGADPNIKGQFGDPLWFMATGTGMPVGVVEAVLAHGADIKITDKDGRGAVFDAVNTSNFRAVLLLLQKGAPYKGVRSINHETFEEMVDRHARVFGDTGGVAEVQEYLKKNP